MELNSSPTFDLAQRASAALQAKQWQLAELLHLELTATGDRGWRQVARNILGDMYEHQQRLEEAIAQYEANIAEVAQSDMPYQRLCIIYRRLGRTDQEERVMRKALQDLIGAPRIWFVDRLHKRQNEQHG